MGRTNEGRSPVRVMVMAAEPWELSVVLVTWEGAGARRAPSETSPVLGPSLELCRGQGRGFVRSHFKVQMVTR